MCFAKYLTELKKLICYVKWKNENRKVAHRKIFSKHTFKKEKPGRKSTKM